MVFSFFLFIPIPPCSSLVVLLSLVNFLWVEQQRCVRHVADLIANLPAYRERFGCCWYGSASHSDSGVASCLSLVISVCLCVACS